MYYHRISLSIFILVCLLLLIGPMLQHLKYLANSEIIEGEVIDHKTIITETAFYNSASHYSVISFNHNDKTIKFYGPQNRIYPMGKKMHIIIKSDNPSNFTLINFSGIYMTKLVPIFLALLIFWVAFFFSFRKRNKKPQ